MAQDTTLTIDGLYTNPSDLAEVLKGALRVAKNIDIDRPSIATPRRGFSRYKQAFTNAAARVKSVFFFDGKVLVRRSDDKLSYWNEGGNIWTEYTGTVAEPETGVPVRAVPGGKSLFLSTASGIKKLTSATGSLNPAGLKAPVVHLDGVINHSGPSMQPNTRIAYRFTVVKKDEHGVVSESPPSDRIVLSCWYSSSYKPKVVMFTNNVGPLTVRLYASPALDISTMAADASDEMALLWEYESASTSETTPVTFYPSQYIDKATGTALYTNATQQGIAAANEQPPRARDIAVFNGYTFYLAPKFKQRALITLNSVDESGLWPGLKKGETITIGSMVLTANDDYSAASSATTRDFRLVYGRNGSAELFTLTNASAVNTATDEFTYTNHYLQTNDQVTVIPSASDTLPTPLVANKLYWVIKVDANKFKLSETYGGSAVNLTAVGTGSTRFLLRAVEGIQPITPDTADAMIEVTAKALVMAINYPLAGNLPSPYFARYISGANDRPGQILIEATETDGAAFTVDSNSTSTETWTPTLYGSATITSSDDYAPNKLAWSKQFQPDSVPLTNVHPGIGSARGEALRILPTRDSLFILKEDGVYRLTGTTAETFSVEDFDTSVQIVAPRAACVMDNMIFCMTAEGPAIVSDLGVDKKFGAPILKELMDLRGKTVAQISHFNANTWAVGHDKRFILSVGGLDASSNPITRIYVFNTRTKTWVTWEKTLTCGETNPFDGQLYVGSPDHPYLLFQDTYYQDADGATVADIASEVGWVMKTLAAPTLLNQFSSINVMMQSTDTIATPEVVTSTDTNTTTVAQALKSYFPVSRKPQRKAVPRNHQRASMLNVSVRYTGGGYYEIYGIGVTGATTSERTQK